MSADLTHLLQLVVLFFVIFDPLASFAVYFGLTRDMPPVERRRVATLGLGVAAAIFAIAFWLTWQLLDYEELGDSLVRLGLGWLFLTFLSFVSFSAVVSSLSTFFLSEDLRLLVAAPVPGVRLFHSRFARTVAQSAWMLSAFLLPVLQAIAAGASFNNTWPPGGPWRPR